MQSGQELALTDGKGSRFQGLIRSVRQGQCQVEILSSAYQPRPNPQVLIAISLLKQPSRWEWFLEKAAELGIARIIPLLCERTEKKSFRSERLQSILISALLQSTQAWLTELHPPQQFSEFIESASSRVDQRFIAHCGSGSRARLAEAVNPSLNSRLILIGPEGDFSPAELMLAAKADYLAVSLGETRLRSETAGVAAASLLALA
jgi:16S rRNA (uracil1498-N3)-methyltransferase